METLELRLVGLNIKPDALKGKDVAELIEGLESALFAIVKREHPEIKEEEIFISLVDIKNQSAGYRFLPHLRNVIVGAFTLITTSIQNNNFESLPLKSIDGLKGIIKVIKRKNCDVEFRINDDTYAVVYPNTVIEAPASAYITGLTTIYPEVKRTGGSIPKVAIQISDGDEYLYVKTTEEITKQLGQRLYSTVGLVGNAVWERESQKIVDFHILEILDYEEVTIQESFSQVRDIIGKYWDDIDDIDEALFRDKPSGEE